jgi:uncharacterized protein (TIGR02453 family)
MARRVTHETGQHPFFSEDLFRFLVELRAHNDRAWFQANKARYEAEVREPMLAFIMAFADPLRGLNEHVVADPRPVGGSMFRIFRDTRFARDKTPYKTNAGAQFRHRECPKDVHSPGFYLHLEPGGCFAGGGLWHPDADSLHKVRERIVTHDKEWKALKRLGVSGETLKRVPQGFDPGHPLAEDLKLKDFFAEESLTEREICAPDFLERFTGICRRHLPLMAFLAKALELPW